MTDLRLRRGPFPRFAEGAIGVSSLGGRINLLIALAIVCQICGVGYQLVEYRAGIWNQRRHELASVAGVALSIVNSEYSAAQSGKMSSEAARAEGIADIAGQAVGQSTTLKQVNMAIGTIEQTTQQNAAMAEESSAACQSLARESARLADLVGEFVVREASESANASAKAERAPPFSTTRAKAA